jgi:YD repeat-containing protein
LQNLTDAVGRKVTFLYASGLLQGIQDWADRRTTFAYNTGLVAGKPVLTTVTGPSGCQTQYQYNSQGLLTGIVDPNGYGTSYAYDSMGRVASRVVAGAGATTYAYGNYSGGGAAYQMRIVDALGRISSQISDPNSLALGYAAGNGMMTSLTRNSRGQITSKQNALGNIWSTSYDSNGNAVGTIDPLGRVTTVSVDSYNNPTKIMAPDGTITTQVWGATPAAFTTPRAPSDVCRRPLTRWAILRRTHTTALAL